MHRIALTRSVSPRLAECELTHLEREPIDVERARVQHAGYERALAALGCEVRRVDSAPEHPDSVFIEDMAVVLDEVAVLARPGAAVRRGEVEGVARALGPLRPVARIEAPGTLDGGDVLRVGRHLFVGRSGRTNEEGIRQFAEIVSEFGYGIHSVQVSGCLHLKTAVTALDDETLLLNPDWVGARQLAPVGAGLRFSTVEVDPTELMGANILRVGAGLLYGDGFPATLARIRAAGFDPLIVDLSELAKAEGAVTCCSVIVG